MFANTKRSYGWVTIGIHWVTAVAVVGMFILGWWMLTLTYYDDWYRLGPWWHKSIGITLFGLTLFRVIWKVLNPRPAIAGSKLERKGTTAGHILLYLLLLAVMISGYMISTADGSSITVFGLFDIPGFSTGIERQEDIAGDIHWYSALTLIVMASGHAVMALKHHFVNKDNTFRKIISTNPER